MCGVNETALAEQIAGLDVDLDAVDETVDIELQPEPLFEKNGHKVSKSPWGPDDEIGRLNWVTPRVGAGDHGPAQRSPRCSTCRWSTGRACRRGRRPAIRLSASG